MASVLIAGATVGVCGTLFAAGVPVDQATQPQIERASADYSAGKEAFEASRFEEALSLFRRSHDVVASPNTRYMIVASLSELNRAVEAYKEASAGMVEARAASAGDAKYKTTLADLTAAKERLRAKIGMITVRVPPDGGPDATVMIDGESQQAGVAVPVEAGVHTVRMSGYDPQTVDVAAGGDETVELQAPALVAVEVETDGDSWFIDNRRTIAYVAGGVGVAGLALFGTFGGLALSKEGDLDASCTPDKRCPTDSQGDIDDGQTFQTTANVMLVVGSVALAAGVGLFVWDVMDDPEGGEESATLQLVFGPSLLGARGKF